MKPGYYTANIDGNRWEPVLVVEVVSDLKRRTSRLVVRRIGYNRQFEMRDLPGIEWGAEINLQDVNFSLDKPFR